MKTNDGEALRYRFLSEEDSERLYATTPGLGASPDDYCPTCNKKGYYVYKGQKYECDCTLQLQLYKHYLNSGIGVTYQRLTWDDYEGNLDPFGFCEVFLENHEEVIQRGIGLTFGGGTGIGKTMLQTLLMKEYLKMGYEVYVTTANNVVELFTATWRSVEEKEYFRRRLIKPDVLLIDDIGKESVSDATPFVASIFGNIIRERVQNGRAIHLTTNLPAGRMTQSYQAATISLLEEVNKGFWWTGTDHRERIGGQRLQEALKGEVRPIV